MNTCGRGGRDRISTGVEARGIKLAPIAQAVALALVASGVMGNAHAQLRAFSPGWYGVRGAVQSTAAATGLLPNGAPVSSLNNPGLQQQQATAKLQRSIDNLSLAAHGIAAMQAAQAAARQAVMHGASVPDGLASGGLAVDTNSLTAGWLNANAPVQSQAGGQTTVAIQQTADKAILNWETFNVGGNTTVQFQQQSDWAVLNRVNDPLARPSQIQGQIRGDGTVMIVNRNGIVFSGGSQVNVRNLAAAAASISDSQFTSRGLYGATGATASFTDANGGIAVEQGARISTHEPASVTTGGGYVLLLGKDVSNAGEITTRTGQTALAAGDSFYIRKGVGTDANTFSTTRGNEIAPQFVAGSTAGAVSNSGLIVAREGDITLTGRDVEQNGVALSTTTVGTRGTIHMLTSMNDAEGQVRFGQDAVTAIIAGDVLIDGGKVELRDDGQTALDSQRDALIADSARLDPLRKQAAVIAGRNFDNLSTLADRRDLSRIEVVSGGQVDFAQGSLTLATGGQLAVAAGNSTAGTAGGSIPASTGGRVGVEAGAQLDVAGSVGVTLAMESNNVQIKVQGFELRDAPVNRDSGLLNNSTIWVDRSNLILVPAGTGGYESDRWYTAGGLLEAGGYLSNQGHGIGEWTAQGGIVQLAGDAIVTAPDSRINLSGGSLNVQTGYIKTTWLKGSDGRLYSADMAPADIAYDGIYTGFKIDHPRWGFSESFYNPLIAPQKRLQNGYTAGRDAGQLVVWSANAVLDGAIDDDVYNGPLQNKARANVADAYRLSQSQVALPGRLAIRTYDPNPPSTFIVPAVADVNFDGDAALTTDRSHGVWLDAGIINSAGLSGLSVLALGDLRLDQALTLAPGGALDLAAGNVSIDSDVTVRGGAIRLAASGDLTVNSGVLIDTRGLWSNLLLNADGVSGLAFLDGGAATLSALGDLNLKQGSRIDASAGGAVLANGKTRGGAGGDIALTPGGELALDGELASFGFTRGGKLSITTPQAVSIGGALSQNNGVLGAGEVAPLDLTLSEATLFPAGSRPPFAYQITADRLEPDAVLPPNFQSNIRPDALLTTAAEWILPSGVNVYAVVNDAPVFYGDNYGNSTVPANSTVSFVYNPTNQSFVLPGNVFPDGVPMVPVTTTYAAGTVLQKDFVAAAGTVIPKGASLAQAVNVTPGLNLDTGFFKQGFSAYSLNSYGGVVVQPGARLDVTMPVYRFTNAGMQTPTGADPVAAGAAELYLPPLFSEDPIHATLTQRAGADITLESSLPPGPGAVLHSGGTVIVGKGAAITVDPGRDVNIAAAGQITIDGAITAQGGEISIVNQRSVFTSHPLGAANDGYNGPGATSVWIGEDAVLDASGRADTALDSRGRSYGIVSDGGSIFLGSEGGRSKTTSGLSSTEAWVVVRPGARVDASGASAVLDRPFGANSGRQRVSSDGGSISLSSYSGIFVDDAPLAGGGYAPALRAAAGGEGASGGALSVTLESPIYINVQAGSLPPELMSGRVLTIGQQYAPSALAADLAAGELDGAMVVGQARIGVGQINNGGFDVVSLWGRNGIAFDGDVTLHAGRSLTLSQGTLFNTTAGGNVTLHAPYVLLDGWTELRDSTSAQFANVPSAVPAYPSGGTLAIEGDLVDARNLVRTAFDTTRIESHGDLRLLVAAGPTSASDSTLITTVAASGDLDLIAAQVYPATGVRGVLQAGSVGSGAVLSIHGDGGDAPALPYSVFGSLAFYADTIQQDGIVRAPLGSITMGAGRVELLDGSITSISARGLDMPYGGTVDGVSYQVNGAEAAKTDLFSGSGGIQISAASLVSDAGSLLDLSGGGNLAGAGFVAGRGGSVDALLNPLNKGGQVYAILPGVATTPVAGSYMGAWTGAVPEVGRQITIPDGVPGLAAGTYTLLPANYALLPGAYRVELGAQATAFGGALALRNGSYLVDGVQSIAHTGIRDAQSTQVTVTPGAALRTYSQYNEQGYADFQIAKAGTFGTIRPMIEADGKMLAFAPQLAPASPAGSALVFNGMADFSAAAGGNQGSFALVGGAAPNLSITGPGSSTANDATRITVAASELAAVDAPNLYIGGVPQLFQINFGMRTLSGNPMESNLVIERGARLTGSQVVLAADGKITLEEGVEINTLGRGVASLDSSSGLLFGPKPASYIQTAMLAVSNGVLAFDTPSGMGGSSIEIKDGVSLYSDGSVGFYSDSGVAIDGNVQFGTRNLALSVPAFNIGSSAALAAAGTLPAGMNLNQGVLDHLLNGNPAVGAPALERLILGAQSINFFGSIDLNTIDPATGKSRLGQLIFNSPAIYGYGGANDVVRLTTDTFVWNGTSVATFDTFGTPTYHSATPGAVLAGGTGAGRFDIDANTIVFGYPAPAQPNTALTFDRLMLGFSNVNLNAADRITANALGTLSVYQSGADPATGFDPKTYAGVGGALNLNTPLLTGDAGSVMGYYVGGALNLAPPAGSAASAALPAALGAEVDLKADSISVGSAIVLASGKLTMTAAQDITLADGSRLDLSGQTVPFFDVEKYSWGGDIALESTSGNIIQQAGSVIDISAANNNAGTLKLAAAGAGAGRVQLDGILRAAGGAGRNGGSIDLRAQRIGGDAANLSADFAALNTKLTDSGMLAARAFDLKQGDLVIGNEVKAHSVSVSVDAGDLTVNGAIDASGETPGSIRLAARDDLTLAPSAVLDVHGSILQVDSYNTPVEAKNRGTIELTSTAGTLTLAAGATLDLSSPDGIARGRMELNAARAGSSVASATGADAPANATGADVAISAAGPLAITGAQSIAVNGFASYANAPANPNDANGQLITQGFLDLIDQDSQAFANGAYANSALQARLAGLTAYGSAFHLRPGVEITSATPNGNLTVSGDLDLSGYRYGPNADRNPASASYGAGEPLSFLIRAGGNLDINGSINDGFAPPKATPDDDWFHPVHQVIPAGATRTDNWILETDLTILADWTVPDDPFYQNWNGEIDDVNWSTYYPGTVVPAGTTIVAGSTFEAGVPLPSYQGTAYSSSRLWAVAPMLAAGSLSSSIRLVSGADLAAADARALQSASVLAGMGNMTLDDYHIGASTQTPIFSVIRTGTGNLDVLAGGKLSQDTAFGIYTAGTDTQLPAGNEAFNLPRLMPNGSSVLGESDPLHLYENALNDRATWYPDHGGDLLVVAQGSLTGNIYNQEFGNGRVENYAVADWLWRQGGAEMGISTSWAINFGTYIPIGGFPQKFGVVGFSGFGALGGGNVTILAGGDAGNLAPVVVTPTSSGEFSTSTGLTVAVGATGRVTSVTQSGGSVTGGTLVQGGGGDINVKIGGRLNPASASAFPSSGELDGGTFTDLRGDIDIAAGAIGRINPAYGANTVGDPRAFELYKAGAVSAMLGGPVVVPGDGTVAFRTLGDLVLNGAGDPGMLRGAVFGSDAFNRAGTMLSDATLTGVARTWFSLWTDQTAISLFSAGGNLAPVVTPSGGVNETASVPGNNGRVLMPSKFQATAATGSIYYGSPNSNDPKTIELAPSAGGQLELLAMDSIYAGATAVSSGGGPARFDMSGAATGLDFIPNPFNPAFVLVSPGSNDNLTDRFLGTNTLITLGTPPFDGAPSTRTPSQGYFAFEADAPTTSLHAADTDPMRIYAVNGDIVSFLFGETAATGAVAAKAAQVRAGRDLVGFGASGFNPPNVILNANDTDVSAISAGRDIFYANVQVAGPGTLEVTAGGNLYQAEKGSFSSIGPIVTGDTRPGADIVLQAGVGASGPDYAGLMKYLDPANLLPRDAALAGSGKVVKTYDQELAAWLKDRYGFAGSNADTLAYFSGLAPEQQHIFLRSVYFAELKAGGREYNDPDSRRYGSYLRGRDAIAALFPEADADGRAIERSGDITMFGGSGVRTLFGGDIQVLAPAGQVLIGVEGQVPPSTAGIITQGAGDIGIYSKESLLLGLSRIMTTFGGGILAWSAQGDINAGRGSKTTVVYTPPKRTYDNWGDVALSSNVPSTGAGIATLNPIPEVPAGDVDLIAPLGTIDAGEAGIRVSGNVNLAALQVVNAANIEVKGKSAGIPLLPSVNVGALANAGAAASQAAAAAQDVVQRERVAARQSLPSIFSVRVLGFGNEPAEGGQPASAPPARLQSKGDVYDPGNLVQLVGLGQDFDAKYVARMSPEQRRRLQQDR